MWESSTREQDELVLQMLVWRTAGCSAGQIAKRFGVRDSFVRTVTNRVFDADLVESGEPADLVAARHGWHRSTGRLRRLSA